MITREDIAAALNDAFLDVDASIDPPPAPQPGQAWATWVRSTPLGYCTNEDEWLVRVALPATSRDAARDTAHGIRYEIQAALSKIGEVQELRPADLGSGEQSIPALEIELITS